MRPHYLLDTSALFRILGGVTSWDREIQAGVIAICPAVELEFLYSARSLADRRRKQDLLKAAFTWIPMHERSFERAQEVQQFLTESGQHRSAKAIDLVIAATAESAKVSVLTDDRDYEAISRVTGQPVARVM
ncbi:MAG: PIN domain nuclease [Actinobacteria bacterium]|nr:PIN domain nuclease [Actinomycetota bacterium]